MRPGDWLLGCLIGLGVAYIVFLEWLDWNQEDEVILNEDTPDDVVLYIQKLETRLREGEALVVEATEIMQITYAGNFPAGIEGFLVRADLFGKGETTA